MGFEANFEFFSKPPELQYEEFMSLSYEERTHLLAMLTPASVKTINTLIPNLPYIQYLNYLANSNQWVTPTVEHLRDFADQFRDGTLSFPRN